MPKKGKGLGALIKDKPTKSASKEKNLKIFRDAVKDAYEDGKLSKDEAQILHTLGNNLDIKPEERKEVSKEIKAEWGHELIEISDELFEGDEDLIPTWINDSEPRGELLEPDEPVFKDETYDFDDEVEDDSLEHVKPEEDGEKKEELAVDDEPAAEEPSGDTKVVYCFYCSTENTVELTGERVDFDCSGCGKPQFTTKEEMDMETHAVTCECAACKRRFVYMDDMKVAFCPWCDEENAL